MKKNHDSTQTYVRLTTFFFMLLFVSACDTIDKNNYLIPMELPAAKQKVLIEDYTGMKCPNCPKGATIIDSLKSVFGENIIPVSIHSGVYAQPSGIFTKDFRTEAGTAYNSYFGVEAYPTGIVNRNLYHDKLKIDIWEWNGAVIHHTTQESPLGISISGIWSEGNRNLTLKIEISVFRETTPDLKLQVWLVEDSIVAPQVNETKIEKEYVHNRVLRGAINGTWGETLTGITKNTIISKTIQYNIPENFIYEKCSIVAFVYKEKDKSVVQVNELKL